MIPFRKEVSAVPACKVLLSVYISLFNNTLEGHAILVIFLFAIMNEHRWSHHLKKLPVLLISPLINAAISLPLFLDKGPSLLYLILGSGTNLLMCTIWVKWTWRLNRCQAFAATCMAAIFQIAASCLARILFLGFLPESSFQDIMVTAIIYSTVFSAAALLHRLQFAYWFRLVLENTSGQFQTATLLFAMSVAMSVFLILQNGVRPEYRIPYCLLVGVQAALVAGLILYLARNMDTMHKVEAQRDVIAQQQLYERDLEAIRWEVRSFRHDYKNLLAGLFQQANEGETDALCAALSELDAGFDRRIGEKIRASAQIGNLRIPQVRSLLLSKLTEMEETGTDCRLEVLYPVERVEMDPWDFVRCLGILLDNAIEAASETESPWVEIVLLALDGTVSLRIANPYAGTVSPDKIWKKGFSTKGAGRGLGLHGYQRILDGYSNAMRSTSWAEGVFIQELKVKDKP